MKTKFRILLSAITFIAALALLVAALALPLRLAAQYNQGANPKHHHYKLIDIGTFGGPESFINGTGNIFPPLNMRGMAVGGSATSVATSSTSDFFVCGGPEGLVPNVFHGFKLQNGMVTDLGALESPTQNCSNAGSINTRGEIVGDSEIDSIDPLFEVKEVRAALWKQGQIMDLGTLGGSASLAAAINDRGVVVGFALNAVPDPVSMFYFVIGGFTNGTQTRAFRWQNGVMQDLGTLGGPDALADFVNERGQIAGSSYTNSIINPVTGIPTTHPFLWENGVMTDLGTLGGTLAFFAAADMVGGLNNHGQVVGESNLAGDLTFHPFLWTPPGPMQDLGTLGGDTGYANALNDAGEIVGKADLPGSQIHDAVLWRNGVINDLGTQDSDPCSNALGINARGQIVGGSSDCNTFLHAFLISNGGGMVDLNSLIPPYSALTLTEAITINERGEIAGMGVPAGCSPQDASTCGHAYVLIPCDENHPGIEGCDYSLVEAPAAVTQPVPVNRDASRRALPQSFMRRMSPYRFPGRAFAPRN